MTSDYIFFTGAPGSKWSGLAKWLYWSPSIDQSDYKFVDREYFKDKNSYPMHTGSYFDPGMEFNLGEWDKPFIGDKTKLIKSHAIAEDLSYFKNYPIIMVHRDDKTCIDWWYEAGGFDISYPDYKPYYKDRKTMWEKIQAQNIGIRQFIRSNYTFQCETLYDVNEILNLDLPPGYNPKYPSEKLSPFIDNDIKVYVYSPPPLHEG